MKERIIIAMAVVCAVAMGCVAFLAGYMRRDYEEAEYILEYAVYEGNKDCHIERDGVYYNVYCAGEVMSEE